MHGRIHLTLTARTLRSDVLPAFWRPTIVTSISKALVRRSAIALRGSFSHKQVDCTPCGRSRTTMTTTRQSWRQSRRATHQNVLSNQSYTFRKIPAIFAVYAVKLDSSGVGSIWSSFRQLGFSLRVAASCFPGGHGRQSDVLRGISWESRA